MRTTDSLRRYGGNGDPRPPAHPVAWRPSVVLNNHNVTDLGVDLCASRVLSLTPERQCLCDKLLGDRVVGPMLNAIPIRQVLRLQRQLTEAHAGDDHAIRRAYTALVQHITALQHEAQVCSAPKQ